MEILGKSTQVTFVHGETSALPLESCFDAALSILVAHFIADDIKPAFFKDIYKRLKEKSAFTYLRPHDLCKSTAASSITLFVFGSRVNRGTMSKMLERMAEDFLV